MGSKTNLFIFLPSKLYPFYPKSGCPCSSRRDAEHLIFGSLASQWASFKSEFSQGLLVRKWITESMVLVVCLYSESSPTSYFYQEGFV